MAQFDMRMCRAVDAANTATNLANIALQEFAAYCAIGNFAAAEEARLKVISHLEAHMDGIASTYRALQE